MARDFIYLTASRMFVLKTFEYTLQNNGFMGALQTAKFLDW